MNFLPSGRAPGKSGGDDWARSAGCGARTGAAQARVSQTPRNQRREGEGSFPGPHSPSWVEANPTRHASAGPSVFTHPWRLLFRGNSIPPKPVLVGWRLPTGDPCPSWSPVPGPGRTTESGATATCGFRMREGRMTAFLPASGALGTQTDRANCAAGEAEGHILGAALSPHVPDTARAVSGVPRPHPPRLRVPIVPFDSEGLFPWAPRGLSSCPAGFFPGRPGAGLRPTRPRREPARSLQVLDA